MLTGQSYATYVKATRSTRTRAAAPALAPLFATSTRLALGQPRKGPVEAHTA